MEINGKEYEIRIDVPFGVIRKLNKQQSDDDLVEILQKLLKPTPSEKEIDAFPFNKINEIFAQFAIELREAQSDIKKKVFQ